MDTRQVNSTTRGLWLIYLTAGILVVVAYYLAVRSDGPPLLRVALYCLVSVSAAVAVLVGCARNLPDMRARLPWMVLGFSQVVYAVADICFYTSHNVSIHG